MVRIHTATCTFDEITILHDTISLSHRNAIDDFTSRQEDRTVGNDGDIVRGGQCDDAAAFGDASNPGDICG